MIRRNLFWKLLSLAVAVILWAYVNAERNPRSAKTFAVPIEIKNLAKGYAGDLKGPHEATIKLQGPSAIVDSVRKDDVSAWIDVGDLGTSANPVETDRRVMTRVAGVSQEDAEIKVAPGTVTVRIEEVRSRKLPVELKLLSPPPLGYSYGEPSISPSSLAVSGRASAVMRVARLIITPSPPDGSRAIDQEVEVQPVDAKGAAVTGVRLDEDRVHIKLGLVESPATKLVLVSARILGQPKHPAEVRRVVVTPPTVTVEGKPDALMDLSTVFTEPVDIDDAQTTVATSAAVRVPAGVRLVGRRQVEVVVQISAP